MKSVRSVHAATVHISIGEAIAFIYIDFAFMYDLVLNILFMAKLVSLIFDFQ